MHSAAGGEQACITSARCCCIERCCIDRAGVYDLELCTIWRCVYELEFSKHALPKWQTWEALMGIRRWWGCQTYALF